MLLLIAFIFFVVFDNSNNQNQISMGFIQRFNEWTAAHNPKWLALVRVALGAALLLRGVNFLNDLPGLDRLIEENNLTAYSDLLRNSIPCGLN